MFSLLRHLVGWIFSAFGSRQDLVLENRALRQAVAGFAHQATAAPTIRPAQAVLGPLREAVVGMAEAADPGDPTHCGGVALCWLSAVLEIPFPNQTSCRSQACG